MGFRFFRRMSILPGVTLNLSKSGGSVSLGPRGAKVTMGPRGSRFTLGLPGTGLSYTTTFSLGKLGTLFGRSSSEEASKSTETATSQEGSSVEPATSQPKRKLPPREQAQVPSDFFDRLTTTAEQKALAEGCRALAQGDEEKALGHLQDATHLADGAFLAGFLALKKGYLAKASQYLETAAEHERDLGRYLSEYGLAATMDLAITEELLAHVGPDIRGVLLALAEAYQAQERARDAIACLERLQQLEPEDVVVKLSLAELLIEEEAQTGGQAIYRKVMQLSEGVENDTAVHTALLLYKAQALRGLGFLDGALEVLSEAVKRKKDRSDELLKALRYQRALVYEGLRQDRKARAEWEKLYAEDPDYEDVAARLEKTR